MLKMLAVSALLALCATSAHAQAGVRVGAPGASPSFSNIRPNLPNVTGRGFDGSRLNAASDPVKSKLKIESIKKIEMMGDTTSHTRSMRSLGTNVRPRTGSTRYPAPAKVIIGLVAQPPLKYVLFENPSPGTPSGGIFEDFISRSMLIDSILAGVVPGGQPLLLNDAPLSGVAPAGGFPDGTIAPVSRPVTGNSNDADGTSADGRRSDSARD